MTIGDILAQYPPRTAWKMIFVSMLKKIKREMDRPRIRRRGK
jgi:hypothetical protein